MLKIEIIKREFQFAFPAGTSRGVLTHKSSWYLRVTDNERPGIVGIGECSPIWGLSPENEVDFEKKLQEVSGRASQFDFFLRTGLLDFPSIRFGLETAVLDFLQGNNQVLFPSDFTKGQKGIRVNGLIWMSEPEAMVKSARTKITEGFSCIKFKIGTHDWSEEQKVLTIIRNELGNAVEIRVDANGAYTPEIAKRVMESCAKLQVHSIEQPIKPGQYTAMRMLVDENTTPVALDEELIGLVTEKQQKQMLEEIKPAYLVIKPSLVGGLAASREWIQLAHEYKAGWWITSMLESNIGLNAIAQFAATLNPNIPQGLGTEQIYTNNIDSPLELSGENLFFKKEKPWIIPF